MIFALLSASVTLVVLSYLLPKPRYERFEKQHKHNVVKLNVIHVDFKQKRRVA
jgi:hypothetical protein